MSTELSRIDSEPSEKPWGKANPRRGAGYVDIAIAFARDHPVGTLLTPAAFDEWAHGKELLRVPRSNNKQSEAWLAHLQRRHRLRYGINKAASHPRMETPFVIDSVGPEHWEVRPPQIAISRNVMLDRVESLIVTKRKSLNYLMQSADWSILPPHERAFAEALYDDIDMFQRQLELQATGLGSKFAKLEHKLRKAIESGDIRPMNGGIKAILEGVSGDDAEDASDA